ncbi:hypothetical protein T484DRAFT_1743899 [Baffinella frigidus]|nr:hypothetical protein T484DRAFT_1743899 [Cryptophyta sp. CCMP2293]
MVLLCLWTVLLRLPTARNGPALFDGISHFNVHYSEKIKGDGIQGLMSWERDQLSWHPSGSNIGADVHPALGLLAVIVHVVLAPLGNFSLEEVCIWLPLAVAVAGVFVTKLVAEEVTGLKLEKELFAGGIDGIGMKSNRHSIR